MFYFFSVLLISLLVILKLSAVRVSFQPTISACMTGKAGLCSIPKPATDSVIPRFTITHLAGITVSSPVAQALIKTGVSNQGISGLARHHPFILSICNLTPIQNFVRGILQCRVVRVADSFAPADAAREVVGRIASRPWIIANWDVGQVVDHGWQR